MRTHLCGELRPEHAGQTVTVCGWVARRREHGEHLAFVDVRDHTGVVQCVVDNSIDVRSEYVVRVTGVVRMRPEGTVNTHLPTGEVEVGDCAVEVLRTASPPPFPIDARADDVDEGVRLQYRYLDLRRERMQRNLRLRATINSAVRRSMEEQGFVEVETPMLVPSTPEGAREFLVPSRKEPGSFYALPQSPQLFKQLLMVAGFDRYYQIARCLRDEDLRADRQYEFMQLDAEMSFVSQDDVLEAISEAVLAAAEAATGERPPPIERITWREAMNRFGVDKPDLRFGMELVELTDAFAGTEFKAFAGADSIKAIRVPGAAGEYGRNQLDKLTDRAKALGAKGLVWLKVADDGSFDSPVAKFLSPPTSPLRSPSARAPKPVISCSSSPTSGRRSARCSASCATTSAARPCTRARTSTSGSSTSRCSSVVTSRGGRSPDTTRSRCRTSTTSICWRPTRWSVRSQAYDLVLNGWELGSGSIRIHETELQKRVFAALGITDEQAMRKFGFFLSPFEYGAPPHGGFAFGIDRLVAILAGEEQHPRGHRLPQDPVGCRPDDRRAVAGRARPARPARHPRPATRLTWTRRPGTSATPRPTWCGRRSRTASCRQRSPAWRPGERSTSPAGRGATPSGSPARGGTSSPSTSPRPVSPRVAGWPPTPAWTSTGSSLTSRRSTRPATSTW